MANAKSIRFSDRLKEKVSNFIVGVLVATFAKKMQISYLSTFNVIKVCQLLGLFQLLLNLFSEEKQITWCVTRDFVVAFGEVCQ